MMVISILNRGRTKLNFEAAQMSFSSHYYHRYDSELLQGQFCFVRNKNLLVSGIKL